MKTYTVTFKIQGWASLEVEAESRQEAIDEAAETIRMEHITDWDIERRRPEVDGPEDEDEE